MQFECILYYTVTFSICQGKRKTEWRCAGAPGTEAAVRFLFVYFLNLFFCSQRVLTTLEPEYLFLFKTLKFDLHRALSALKVVAIIIIYLR